MINKAMLAIAVLPTPPPPQPKKQPQNTTINFGNSVNSRLAKSDNERETEPGITD